ncbi:restriction endonuclease subunit S [Streptococcus constellatus]|uniref:restriction endonuclease subunit S n=1 Tax=Streptococcus constellatus TaxID=76860 RepID=UPI0018994C7F|nr:restriction endonuclease subunit S [Streptococcus constellatus]
MSKNIKGAIPKWRFLEFRDSGEWEEKELNESLDYLQPTQYLVQSENYSNNYETPVLTAGKSFVLGYTNEKNGIFNNKLPVIIFDDFTTDSKFVDFPFKVKSSAIKILLAKYNFNIKFIFEIMQMVSYEVSVHKRHWISIFSKLKVLIPKLPEQQKIADCLSSIDDLISVEEKKLSLLNDYKKGWMQKLFPIEGRNVPEWRFPEFRASGEWENTTIGKIADYENGKAHENNIINNGKYIVVNSKFISTEGEIIKYTNEANLLAYKGDILMVLSDVPNGRALSKCYLVDKDNLYTVNQRVCRITPKKINSILFFYTINRNKYFLAFDDGVKQTNLRKNDVLHCSVVIPKDSNEQNKIADFLSGIDELLCRQIDKIEALKKHKKALMQGLFPVAEEV